MKTATRGRGTKIAIALVAGVGALAFSACSSSGGSSTASSAPAESAAAAPASSAPASEAAAEPVSLLPQEILDAGKLRVATSLYPPVDFYDTDNTTLIGFDADIVNEIGNRLGIPIEWNVIDFANVLPGIESKQYDFATDLNDTAEREGVVDFVTHFQDGTSIMVPEANPNSIADLSSLCGLKVVVTKGSTQVDLATAQSGECESAGNPAIDLLQVPDDPEAIQTMKSGRADAYLVNTLAGSYATTKGDVTGFVVIPGVYDPVYAGMIFPKDSTQLRDAIQATLQAMMDDGTYLEIMKKYGVENTAIDTAKINAASGS